MDQSRACSGFSGFSGIREMTLRNVTNQSGKRRGPPICYRPKQPAVDPLPSDGTMTFTVMRQLKESVEVQNQLRLDGKLCDVVLVCGNEKFHCHKIVLAAASPYFNAMFTRGMVECGKHEIPINNIDSEILGYIIQFIYTAEIKLTEHNICPLMQAATMLQMPHIVEACTTFLEHQLDPSNCIGIGKFAQQYGCFDLQKKAERYLLKHFVDVWVCEEFRDLTFDELEKMVGSNQLIVKCESEVYKAVISWVSAKFADRCLLLPSLLDKIRLCNIPPNFLKDQLNYCEILRKAPTSCAEKLTRLFQQMEMHTADAVAAPRNCLEKQVIYCIGGYLRQSVTNVEYFNPANGEWKRVADTLLPKSGLAACTILGYIYAVGGRNSHRRNEDLSVVDCYNPKTNEWCSMPPMRQRRNRVSVAVLDNKLFAVGGSCGVEAFSTVECFDPSTREWSSVASMNSKRIAAGLTVVNRFLYAVGGSNGDTRLSTMERYHPEQNRWINCPSMSTARSGTGVASLDFYIYVAGGFDSTTQLNLVERFNTRTEQWERVSGMQHARSALNMVALDGKLYALGGYGGTGFVDVIECYNPETDTWSEVGRMLSGRSGQGVTLGPAASRQLAPTC